MDYEKAWLKLKEEIEASRNYMENKNETEIVSIDKNVLMMDLCKVFLKTMDKIENELSNK